MIDLGRNNTGFENKMEIISMDENKEKNTYLDDKFRNHTNFDNNEMKTFSMR